MKRLPPVFAKILLRPAWRILASAVEWRYKEAGFAIEEKSGSPALAFPEARAPTRDLFRSRFPSAKKQLMSLVYAIDWHFQFPACGCGLTNDPCA